MDGKVRVLLVSAGGAPVALVTELERLGVEITSCVFADAEEYLETDPPDLVALAGALGAIELANMIDDLDEGPRMVIVAERKELAKLRGLNREVVVSLFAMETTEKVVGQRIESLARRAARRREHRAAPEPKPLKKTAMGLPSAAQVAKVDLKKMEAPPSVRPKAPLMEESAPPSSGSHPGAEPAKPAPPREAPEPKQEAREAEKPAPPKKPNAAIPTMGAEPEPNVGGTDSTSDDDPWIKKEPERPPVEAIGKLEKKPPPIRKKPAEEPRAKPEVPKPPLPARSSREEAEQSIMVIDEDLLESILPDGPAGEIPEISAIPMISVVPDPDDAPVSHPPTLPPAAKAQAARGPGVVLKAASEELDISDAESALENLDSIKLEITPDLVEHAQREMGSSEPELYDEDTVVGQVAGGGMETSDAEEPDAEEPGPDAPGPPALSFDQTMPLDAALGLARGAAREGGPGEAELRDEEVHGTPGGAAEDALEVFPRNDGDSQDALVEGAPLSTMLPAVSKKEKKGGGAKALGLVAVVAALVGGVYVMQSGALGKDTSAGASAPPDEPPEVPNPSSGKADAPLPTEGPAANTADEAEPADGASSAEEPPVEKDEVAPEDHQDASSRAPSAGSLDNPFRRPAVQAPTCEALVSSAPPEQGDDPVHLASEAWDQARGAIVGGKLDDAHKFMCQAVTLNPQSAAIEGLAGHYLTLGDYDQALKWAEKADALRPGQMDIGNLKGDVYGMMGDVDKARTMWLQMLNIGSDESARLVPISKDYSVEAGRHLRRGDLVRAELFFRRAVILDPENLNGIIGLAKVYHRLEMPQYARAFCEMSLKVSDVIPEVHVMLGELALAEGKKDEARERFERALAVRPGFFPAKRGLSQVK